MRQADRRLGGQAVRTALALLTAYPSNRLSAQDSQFSVRGLGVPGRWESVRARTAAGAFGPFDPRSSVADVSLADALQLTATAVEATTRSEEHTSELQSLAYLVCRLLLEKKKNATET